MSSPNTLRAAPFRRLALTTTALFLALPFLAGCAAGPDFKAPQAPQVSSYGPNGMPVLTNSADTEHGGMQRFRMNGDVPAAWWRLFENAQLTHLMDQAVTSSPTLEAAQAALRVAQENAAATTGGFFPSIEGTAGVNRTRGANSLKPYSVFNTGVSVSYAPDVFGGLRRASEAADARVQAQKFETEATYLTLTSNIASSAIQEAALRGQIAATKDIIASQRKQLELTRARFDAGAVAKTAVLAQEATVAASEASLPPLDKKLSETRNLLAVLAGRFPGEGVGASFELSSFKLPEEIPVSLPSKLVEQRPDIRAARASLEAANAEIGVATAAMLPQFPLTASYAVSAGSMSSMFGPGTALWGLGAGLVQPIFKGGELLHKKRAAVAAFDQAAAQYRAVVLSAFKDVANALQALESDAQALQAQLAAERAAAASLELTQQQYNAGAVDYVALLSAQATHQQSEIALVQAKAQRLADTIVLYQALGGGWWNRETETTKK